MAEGFHLANALAALERAGLLDGLRRPASAGELASKYRVDRRLLEAALNMLAARTDLVARRAGKYRVTAKYDAHARFITRQYLGAYGRNAVELPRILRRPASAEGLIDRRQHARAFAQAATLSADILRDLIVALGLNHVLDLGCGGGALLLDLASRADDFTGWGIDINRWMCAAARKQIAAADVGGRIAVFHGDCRDLQGALPAKVAERVRTITAASLANEFFARDGAAAAKWLSGLKAMFPGRIMLISDYYGGLNRVDSGAQRQLMLHDFVQAISGQGIPPDRASKWKAIYRAAKCRLIQAIDDETASCFVHVLKF